MVATVDVIFDHGGSSGAHANETLSITGQPGNTETVTIDGKTYTFQTTLTDVDGNVLIGGSASATSDNLRNAINLQGTPGTDYAASTTLHPTCRALDGAGDDITVEARSAGTSGNSIAVSETAANYSFGATTLSGGTNGSPGTSTNITTSGGLGPPNLRFKTADDATIDTLNPIPIPGAGTNWSFWKQIYIEVTAGTFTQIDNVQFYTDGGGFGTGITTNVGDFLPLRNSVDSEGYEVATGTVGTTGDQMEQFAGGHGAIDNVTDAFTYTSAATKNEGNAETISEAGNIIDAVGEGTNYFVFQMAVGTTASPGDLADETWTFQYDEI